MDKFSFKQLIEEYTVIIPMLQRDYAYGRKVETEKRENFLRNLKSYFEFSKPQELDFVYGTVEGNELTLLDGQQRITTLFLLHWYLSLVKNSDGKVHFEDFKKLLLSPGGDSRFLYKTRFSSTDFCNAIVKLNFNNVDYSDKYITAVNDKDVTLSEVIKHEKWFLPHWNYDPTIDGMLKMIDSIKTFFVPEECSDYYVRLVENGQLAFNFLDLEDFKLTNELYIKMNSRGRSLTRFENVKSKMLKLFDDASKNTPIEYGNKLKQVNALYPAPAQYSSLRDYVSFMMDTKWTDLFWNEWLATPDHSEKPNVDDMMLSFIASLAIFDHIIYKLDGRMSLGRKDELTSEVSSLMNDKDKNKGITISYEKLINLFSENNYAFLFKLIDYFNMFNDNGKLKTYLSDDFKLFDEHNAFSYLVNDYKYGMEYERKAKLFAYIKYLSLNPKPNQEHFEAWMRFVCRVCSNSYGLADRTETFCNSIAGLNFLYDEDIVSTIADKRISGIVTLDFFQIEEEILKMKLSSDSDWKKAIDEAETKLSYFEGRLRYPLVECCHIDESQIADKSKRILFEKYVEKIAAIFPNESGCSCESKLIRALLSKGNYLMYFNSNNTMLKNADRDNSWRRFLKVKPEAYHPFGIVECDEREFFKAVLDDPAFDKANVEESLNNIAIARDDSIPMWRRLIIDNEEILYNTGVIALGRDRFIRWNNDTTEYTHKRDKEDNYEIDLIPGSAITGYHSELFSLAKYYELKDICFKSFGTPKYARTKTNMEQPYLYFGDAETPYLKVLYQDDNCFRFVFSDGSEKLDVAYAEVERELMELAY